jgi:hypothetical protein
MTPIDDLKQLCKELAELWPEKYMSNEVDPLEPIDTTFIVIKDPYQVIIFSRLTQDDCDALCASVGKRFLLSRGIRKDDMILKAEVLDLEWWFEEFVGTDTQDKLEASIFSTIHILREAIQPHPKE